MRERENVCKYLDIALQHISNPMLKKMRRNITKEQTYELIRHIREEVPGIHLRTTMLVGHPGETEQDFDELIDFLRFARFERLGAFAYSNEESTYAYEHYQDDISDEIKQQRLDTVMAVQQSISAEINDEKIGKNMKVIIDRKENDYFVGRTEFDSPEVDPEVLIPVSIDGPKVGEFYIAEITGAADFDLYAR
ncbi:Ribosomal protein S12 methylthiotransferase RimO [bioreactor metagenome]|uniref:Ribosomal protein S12 methylthiotransferase RimO n=1 Tax=bioreactor metagenome TaxID=1076179 RepID=A0A645HX62_9ZZZZ